MTQHDFWVIFAAVLSAIMLGGCFFWGAISYTRMERSNQEHSAKGNGIWIAMMMPLLFLAGSFYLAMGGQ